MQPYHFKSYLLLGFFIQILLSLPAAAQKPLVFVTSSIESASVLKKRYQPLMNYLSNQTHQPIILKVSRNYDHTIELLASGQADLSFLGPSPFVEMQAQHPGKVEIAAAITTHDKPFFHSVIVTRKDSRYNSIKDLYGKTFAFGSPRSTASFYYPAAMLKQHGITPEQLKDFSYLGRHDVVAKHVIMGRADAGGIKLNIAEKYSKYLKVIATSDPIYDHVIVVQTQLPESLKQQIKTSLLQLKDPQILNSFKKGTTAFVERDASVFEGLKPMMDEIDQLY